MEILYLRRSEEATWRLVRGVESQKGRGKQGALSVWATVTLPPWEEVPSLEVCSGL